MQNAQSTGAADLASETRELVSQTITDPGSLAKSPDVATVDTNLAGTIVIPDACVTISVDYGFTTGAFEGCSSIEKLVCGSGLNLIFDKSFNGCTSLATVLLNEGLTELGGNAFSGCAITTIDLPSTITDMGNECFKNCSSLATVNCYATTAPTLSGSNHFQSTSATQIHVPVGATGYGTTFAGLTVVAELITLNLNNMKKAVINTNGVILVCL